MSMEGFAKTSGSTVKGVQFNYVQYVWKSISRIDDMEMTGNHYEALKALLRLLNTVPKDIYEMFDKEVTAIKEALAKKRVGAASRGIDWFNKYVVTQRDLNTYAAIVLPDLKRAVCSELDRRGYMEKRSPEIPHGRGTTMRRSG